MEHSKNPQTTQNPQATQSASNDRQDSQPDIEPQEAQPESGFIDRQEQMFARVLQPIHESTISPKLIKKRPSTVSQK